MLTRVAHEIQEREKVERERNDTKEELGESLARENKKKAELKETKKTFRDQVTSLLSVSLSHDAKTPHGRGIGGCATAVLVLCL